MACLARAHSRYRLGDFAFRPLPGKHHRFGFVPVLTASIFLVGFIVLQGADGVTGDLMGGFILLFFNAVLMLLELPLPVLAMTLMPNFLLNSFKVSLMWRESLPPKLKTSSPSAWASLMS